VLAEARAAPPAEDYDGLVHRPERYCAAGAGSPAEQVA
jgi:hypothetical protein